MREGRLVVDHVPDPAPAPGQMLARTLACGICGSDLHTLRHGEAMVGQMREAASLGNDFGIEPAVMSLDQDVIMGHEFAAEVVEVGQNVGNCRPGDTVVSLPVVLDAHGIYPVGYSNQYPGGFAEAIVLSDLLCLKVPNGLPARHAALTEPMAVGVHAVSRSGISPGESAVVLGCGPVGLAVVAALRAVGVEVIVAADFSPIRRTLATTMGATEVVDPRDEPAVEAWRRVDGTAPLVIYEAVGVPGMLDRAMAEAPRRARIMVVGVCMEPDTVRPMRGITRELTIGFALGYEPAEFAETLRRIAEGELEVAPLITGSVDIDGVPGAFEALADPAAHAKILVES